MSQSGQQSQQPNGTATGAPPAHTSKGIVKQVNVVYVSDVIIDTTTTTYLVDGLATLCRFNALTSHSLLPLQYPSLLHLSLSRHYLFLLSFLSPAITFLRSSFFPSSFPPFIRLLIFICSIFLLLTPSDTSN